MTNDELKRLRELAGRMCDAKPLDYECAVTYSLTEPAEPVYVMRDEHGEVIAWAHSVDALIGSVERLLDDDHFNNMEMMVLDAGVPYPDEEPPR